MTSMFMNIMSEKYISAVLSEDEWKQGDFRINPYNGYLQYKVEYDIVDTIDNSKCKDRAAQCSDLYSLLKSRNYNLMDSKAIDPLSGELGFISSFNDDGSASKIEVISSSISLEDIEKITSLQSDLLNMQIGYIPTTCLDDGTGDYSSPERYGLRENYFNFRLIKDLITESTVVNLLSMSDPTYTDTLDISRVTIDNKYDKVSIRLGIQYTKPDSDIVKVKEFIFSYDNDIQYSIDDEVEVEYFNKCIRLFPSDNINECIISYCHLMYE